MKFVYEYRTSDNVRHEGVVAASNREAAFAALRSRGIRPGSLMEAPGFFNKLFGKGKRWIAIGVLGGLVVAAVFVIRSNDRTIRTIRKSQDVFDSRVRHQLIGDAAVIEKGIRTGWADVFALEGDRFLASFAIPGYPAAIRATTEAKLSEALHSPAPASASLEARQVVAIVGGMKDEIRGLLADGWTLREVGNALAKRQDREIGFYERAQREVDQAQRSGRSDREVLALWERKNDELRRFGNRLISIPEEK